jgi:hypothetical protein
MYGVFPLIECLLGQACCHRGTLYADSCASITAIRNVDMPVHASSTQRATQQGYSPDPQRTTNLVPC